MNKNLLTLEFYKFNNKKNFSILLLLIILTSSFLFFINFANKNVTENKIHEYEFEINSISKAIKDLPETKQANNLKKELSSDIKIKQDQINVLLKNDWKTDLKLQIKADEKLLTNMIEGKAISEMSEKELEEKISLNKEFINRNIRPMENDNGTEGLYFLKTITGLFYGLIGIIIIILFFGNILAGEIEKGTIRFLFTQPISKMSILGTKYFASISGSILILFLIFLYSFILSSSIFKIGSFNYPILVKYSDNIQFINLSELLLKGTILFVLVIIFIISLLFFLSVICGNSMLATGITLIITVVCTTLISNFPLISSVAHLIPFSYINSLNVINGKAALNNANITFTNGLIVLFIYSVIFHLITRILFKKKELI